MHDLLRPRSASSRPVKDESSEIVLRYWRRRTSFSFVSETNETALPISSAMVSLRAPDVVVMTWFIAVLVDVCFAVEGDIGPCCRCEKT